MKAIRVHQTGGADALQIDDIATPEPGSGEALLRIEASGVNFIDIASSQGYHRTGLYPQKTPFTFGAGGGGGGGVRPGEDVSGVRPGDRVAYAMTLPSGAYAEGWRSCRRGSSCPCPTASRARSRPRSCFKGMTAHYLSHATFPIEAGHRVLVHAARAERCPFEGSGFCSRKWRSGAAHRFSARCRQKPRRKRQRVRGVVRVLDESDVRAIERR